VLAPFPILFSEAKVGPPDVVRLKESVGDDVGSLVGAAIGDFVVGEAVGGLVVGALVGGTVIGACVFIGFCVGDSVLVLGAFVSLFIGCLLGDPTALTTNTENPVGETVGCGDAE
jgi:hypothetical protein